LSSLAVRMYDVIRRPRATFAAIVQAPSWVAVLIVTTTTTLLCTLGFVSTDVGRQALVDQWERTATAFGQTVDDVSYTRMEERAANGGVGLLYAAGTALAYGPLLVFAVSGVLFAVLRGRSGADLLRGRSGADPVGPRYIQLLAVVAYAGVILALRQVVAAPINYVRESISSPTTLVQFFGMVDEASPIARFLGVIDLFVVWWIVVLAMGVSILYRRPTRNLALAFAGAYVVLALLTALVMAVSGGTA
jgi:Yip1-like protein